jgi:para-aminobenzoate synthetase/4-amino-4-deoxychorismate lyase
MIVDLLRNDLGRIAEIGSVHVEKLFEVETFRTLHQMTSTITAKLKPGLGFPDIIANLFPCGSITGAPKIRAMEIIHELEGEKRGVYTGSIGYLAPTGDFSFNVAIRTAVIDSAGRGEIGIGGGIVADSVAEDEFAEAQLKLKFFTDPSDPVALIETILWERGKGFWLLPHHLDRLDHSARYFAINLPESAALQALETAAQNFEANRMRVRLLLHERDGLSISATPLPDNATPETFRFTIAPEPMDSKNIFLAHKTTRRSFYDEPRKAAVARHGVDEVVFLNERGELTEGSITSLFIERDGILLTPGLDAGLLPGTLRAQLLADGKAREATLTLDDLRAADAIFLGNGVRGLMVAHWLITEL